MNIRIIKVCSVASKEQGVFLVQTAGCYSGGDWDQQVSTIWKYQHRSSSWMRLSSVCKERLLKKCCSGPW